jgi:hypothetical protein
MATDNTLVSIKVEDGPKEEDKVPKETSFISENNLTPNRRQGRSRTRSQSHSPKRSRSPSRNRNRTGSMVSVSQFNGLGNIVAIFSKSQNFLSEHSRFL